MAEDRTGLQSASASPTGAARELDVLGLGVVRERADAARNRLRVLAAAERLFAERGVGGVTMDDVAAAAGVGKGTLYRRFGDKGGLAFALLDERERALQQRMLSGPPPLGPGAAAEDRLAAFVEAYVELVLAQLDLVLLSETSSAGARLRSGANRFWRQHCRYLLDQAGVRDPDVRGDVVLAGLAAEQLGHWSRDEGRQPAAIAAAVADAARALARNPHR